MSRFFPHTPYAEDQPLARAILTTHVLTRAVTTGAIIGLVIPSTRQVIPFLRTPPSGGSLPVPFPERLLVSSGRSVLITMAITSVGLTARMWGRQPIEWQDRSWRLLENRGQVEVDDWTYAGMGAAAAAVAIGGSAGPARLGWKGWVGGMGMGSVGGLVGYLVWRYGVNGGKFVEVDKKGERKGI